MIFGSSNIPPISSKHIQPLHFGTVTRNIAYFNIFAIFFRKLNDQYRQLLAEATEKDPQELDYAFKILNARRSMAHLEKETTVQQAIDDSVITAEQAEQLENGEGGRGGNPPIMLKPNSF